MLTWCVFTGEHPPVIGGVSDYCQVFDLHHTIGALRCAAGVDKTCVSH